MKLERIKIEGYRSLKSVEWKPAPLNVLIGANASGKSNFLQALRLFPAAAHGEFEKVVLDSGGMASVVWNGTADSIKLDLCAGSDGSAVDYQLALHRVAQTGTYSVTSEQLVRGDEVLMTREWADLADAIKPTETMISSRFGRDDATEALLSKLARKDQLAD